MKDPKYSFPIFTPFGGGYIPEAHGHVPPSEHSKGWGKWPMVAVALLLGITTAAAAVIATSRSVTPIPALWTQTQKPPAIFLKAPDAEDFRVLLF
jgi:hypothetical protein